jgi:hypothetical protein
MLHTTDLLEQVGGIPKGELALFWAFPTHSSPVAELLPPVVVPRVTPPGTLAVAVNGTLDPTKLVPTVAGKPGTVTLMDLTATQGGDLLAGLPPFDVSYEGGAVVLRAKQPLVAGHQYGLFLNSGMTSTDGKPMVPSPVSFLLTARGPVADMAGKSQVSTVPDASAVELEKARASLAPLFDNPIVKGVVGLDRSKLTYVFAFDYGARP